MTDLTNDDFPLSRRATLVGAVAAAVLATDANGKEAGAVNMTDADMKRMVHDLWAREQVKELRAKYCWFASRGDYEAVVSLFAPDGWFEASVMDSERKTYRGHEAMRTYMAKSMYPNMVFPLIHNDIILVNGDEAVGACSMEAKNNLPQLPTFCGYYHDKARNFGGTWLFTERRLYSYQPKFERSGLDFYGKPETGLSAHHDRKPA